MVSTVDINRYDTVVYIVGTKCVFEDVEAMCDPHFLFLKYLFCLGQFRRVLLSAVNYDVMMMNLAIYCRPPLSQGKPKIVSDNGSK